jgi:hypothetical protein
MKLPTHAITQIFRRYRLPSLGSTTLFRYFLITSSRRKIQFPKTIDTALALLAA